MALTAHAILFTVVLDADACPLRRYISSILSFIIAFLSRLSIGHMIREVADRAWLQELEPACLPDIGRVHVKACLTCRTHPMQVHSRVPRHRGWRFRKAVNNANAGWMPLLFWLPAF